MTTTNRSQANLGQTGRMIAVLAMAAAGLCSGCTMLDAVDRQLVDWGVVDAMDGSSIDELAVVSVEAGSQRGVGVVLDKGLVFTANHVVSGSDTVIIKTNGYYSDAYHQVLRARVVYRNRLQDQALLALEAGAELDHTVELGAARPGAAKVLPLRRAGRNQFGGSVRRAVVRNTEVLTRKNRMARKARLTHGDSGAPIVQNGRVVGLVRGAGAMIEADVLANYRLSLTARPATRRLAGADGPAETAVPECRLDRKDSRS